ncbi:MAG: LuxR C-terminal-related transcriptional regulator [Actinomycetes bacterium]
MTGRRPDAALSVVPHEGDDRASLSTVLVSRLAAPQPAQQSVPRDRLLARLSAGVRTPLTLVHGPAGSGKTFLVATWVSSGLAPGPVAWVTLDDDADAPGPFWAYVLQALRGCGLSLGEDISSPARAEEMDQSFLARVAAALSECDRSVVLVLDDYDVVSSAAINAGLEFVLRNAAPHLRVVVLSRQLPRLRLARHRVAGELTDIGPAELAFTAGETSALLELYDVPLPGRAAVEDLTERTNGWVTGLRLSAMAMQRGTRLDAMWEQVAAGYGDIADFLLTEVVDQQPAETQDLLLRTCFLDRVNGEIADAMTGRRDGQCILLDLARTGTFVTALPGAPGWFRYHELFATAVQGRLLISDPDLVPELHRQASHWLADHGRLTESVAHAVAARDLDLAAAQVVDHLAVGHLLVGLETHRLGVLLADLPQSSSPHVALVRAALAMGRYDASSCLDALDRAQAGARDVTGSQQIALQLGIDAVRVIVSRLTGDLAAAESAGDEARALMARVPPDRLAQHPELPALVLSSLGTLQLWGGRLDEAEENLRAGLATAGGPFTEHAHINCLGQLALLHWLRGQLRRASECAMEALELVDRSGVAPGTRVPVGHLAAAAVAWEWNDLPAVRTHVEQAASSVAAQHDASLEVLVTLLRARYRMARGDCAEAVQLLQATAGPRARLAVGSFVIPMLVLDEAMALLSCGQVDLAVSILQGLPADAPERHIGLARVWLARGQHEDALAALGETTDDLHLQPALGIQVHLVKAQALHATGALHAARQQLERALRQSRPDGFRRPFVEAAPWVRQMLADHPALAAQHSWLGPRLTGGAAALPAAAPGAPALVVEPLSDREIEVLRLVAQPMSSREVAETLHLSLNTVKTHLGRIYRKLSAPNRNQAVRRARSLGIL